MNRSSIRTVAALFAAFRLAAAQAQTDSPPDGSWRVPEAACRMRLEPSASVTAAVGYAEIGPAGVGAGAASIAVRDPGGAPVGSRVLWARAGDMLKVLFDCSGHASHYDVYLGTALPPGDAPAWQPRAGVILETRAYGGTNVDTASQFEELWAKGRPLGRSLRPLIFDGIHPHGSNELFLSRYDAVFTAAVPGEYGLATHSDDASFLLVDGRPVAEWPGCHSTAGGEFGAHSGTVTLTAGPHTLTYLHAQQTAVTTALAAWKPPGARFFTLMPRDAFLPVAPFRAVAFEGRPGGPPRAAFEWTTDAHASAGGVDLVTVTFRTFESAGRTYRWTFDDGRPETGPRVTRVFITPGRHTVRLDALEGDRVAAAAREEIDVHPLWIQQEECPAGVVLDQKRRLAAFPLDSFRAPELGRLALFADALSERGWLADIGTACLKRSREFSPASAGAFLRIGLAFRHASVRRYADAEQALRVALGFAGDSPALGARIRLALADVLANGLVRPADALQLASSIPDGTLDPGPQRSLRLLVADCLLAAGDRARAESLLRALAGQPRLSVADTVRVRARLESARDFVRRTEYDAAVGAVEQVWREHPLERLSAPAGLVLMDAFAGRGEAAPALALGRRLLAAAPDDDHAAEILLRLSRLYRGLGLAADAAAAEKQLLDEYPFSEAAALATEGLQSNSPPR